MSAQLGTCNCTDSAKTVSPGGGLDASETAAKRAGVAEYSTRKTLCKFSSYEEKYRFLRGKAACNPTIQFPCCTTTNLDCVTCT